MSCYYGPCIDRRDIYLDSGTLMVLCHVMLEVYQVNISLDNTNGTRALCSVYVSGGRNIALHQHIWMSSQLQDAHKRPSIGSFSVDGGTRYLNCSSTDEIDANPIWRITFPSQMLLDEVVIFFRATKNQEEFVVKLINEDDITIYELTGTIQSVVKFIPSNDLYVKSIEVIKWNKFQTSLTICELEAYGGLCTQPNINCGLSDLKYPNIPISPCFDASHNKKCAPPLFGADCTDICSLSCVDHICTYDGFCRHCPNGTGGRHCFDGCITWCDEEEEWPDATPTSSTRVLNPPKPLTYIKAASARNIFGFTS
ncbi:hypothetical protein Btru_032647 [Bulinus truncatus]|nr:hypothetical protein Btru_032647 [Bulinus truncatus]